jgi:hypothetical protein
MDALVEKIERRLSSASARIPRTRALRLAQEAGKAVAHCCLAFMELQAGGWEDTRHGE